jgi:hypothetical protein
VSKNDLGQYVTWHQDQRQNLELKDKLHICGRLEYSKSGVSALVTTKPYSRK